MSLRPDLKWGYATASYQIEGGVDIDGRSPTIWDEFSQTHRKIRDGSTGQYANESYANLQADIQLMKTLGVTGYRFSIAWSRIVPMGGRDDPVNEKGIQWYSDFIDALLENGITPYVTLFHWDLPLPLYKKYGGMLNTDEFVKDFVRYADICFRRFDDRVKYWITFNEPVLVAQLVSLSFSLFLSLFADLVVSS
ncbi:Beta-glucosidase 1B [Paramyrothecium foliicola]|nr:Beta-glucosidase 1B [Paramyrothecium foliicola]